MLSYVVLLLIPILVIGLLVYRQFVGILQEEVTISHRHVLEQASAAMTAEFNEMNDIAIKLSARSELSPQRLNQSMFRALDAMETLRDMNASPFVRQFVYYAKGSDYFYSADTTYPVELFAEPFRQYGNWSSEDFMVHLRSLNKPTFVSAEPLESNELASGRVLTYLVPIPYNSPSPYGVLLFLVEEASVNKLLEGALKEQNGNSVIVNQDGQIITALRHEAYLESPKFQANIRKIASGGMTVATLDNDDSYVISTVKLQHTNWTYATLLPEEVFLHKTKHIQTLFVVSVLIVLCIGCALIYLLMRLNYNPVHQLLSFISKQWGEAVRNVQEAKEKIGHMAEDRQLLKQKLDSNKEAARNYLLLKLLRGQVADVRACNAEGGEIGIAFSKSLFFVALVDGLPASSDSRGLEKMYREHFECYQIDTMDEGKGIVICAIAPEETPALQERLLRLHQELMERCSGKVTIGVGGLYEEIHQIGKSYIEAATALDYKLIKGHNTLITYGGIQAENQSASWYPKEEMELLAQSMRQGDSAKVESILLKLQLYMEERPLPLHIARCICYDIFGCMIKTQDRLRLSQSAHIRYPDAFALAKFDTIHDLASLVRDICLQIKESTEAAPGGGSAEAWIAYIQEHYHDHAFSVERMAEHFSLSRSSLFASFKKLTGQTIMDYLDYYRLERAKRLLSNSDLRLKEIVEQIGYYDVSSFIRKFKQQADITPGEFRKLSLGRDDTASP